MSKAAAADPAAKTEEKAKPAEPAAKAGEETAKPAAGTKPSEETAEAAKPDKTYTQADFDRALEKQKKDHEKAIAAEAAKAKLSDDEKKDATISELQQSLRMRDAKDEVTAALGREGAKATGLMWNAIKGELEFDDKGKLTNLKDLIKELKGDYADQFGEPKPTEIIDGGAGQQAKDTTLTKEKLAAMSPQEIAALDWEDVKKVLAKP